MERYDANPSASIALRLFPETAFEMAYRMPVVVNTVVDRPRHDAMVNGLNRNLECQSPWMTANRTKRTMLRWKHHPI